MDAVEKEIAFLNKEMLGYDLLRDAIYMVAETKGKIVLSKNIFPQIAKKYNRTPASVERDIRYLLKKGGCDMSIKQFICTIVVKYL